MKYEVVWIEEERAGVIVEAKNRIEALAIAQSYNENHPQVRESFDRIAIGPKRFKITKL